MKRIFPISGLILLVIAMAFSSCLKKNYDTPPDQSGYDPNLPVTTTIAQLQSMPQSQITDDITISGVVCMDDRSGNYYKKVVIQDSTGGIEVLMDQTNLYTDYPIGRKIYVKCKGLYVGSYHSLPQLGGAPDATGAITAINGTTINDYVIKATFPNKIPVDTFNYSDLINPSSKVNLLNKIVAIRDVQFADIDAGQVYASASATTNRTLATCSITSGIVVRSSNYSKFQPILTPTGQGVIVGLYTRYDATPQLIIRDTTDVRMYGARCGSGGGGNTGSAALVSIDSIRSIFAAGTATLGAYKITGVVISDKSTANYQAQNLVLQQGNTGIIVRFNAAHSFLVGDSITVTVTGGALQLYSGVLELSGLQNASATKSGTGTIVPRVATIQQINTNYAAYESTLVQIANVTFPSGTYSGNRTLSDGTGGSITMYTIAGASFSGQNMPTTTKTVIGIIGEYNTTKQIQIRNPASDIQ